LLVKKQSYFSMARTKDFDEDEVLEKAVRLFWHKGYNGTSMQDLVDGLGISRSSLYDTYGDKHALFMKSLESYKNTVSSQMCTIISDTVSAKEAIKQLLDLTTSQLLNDEQHNGCFMVNAEVEVAPHDKEVSSMICQGDQQVEDAFYRAIKKGQENGELNDEKDARAVARFIFNTVKGIRVSAKSTSDKRFFDDIIQLTMSVLD
jgi:TetR/AcrR family transcriptional regulator, transcriptional repressor for nem operon